MLGTGIHGQLRENIKKMYPNSKILRIDLFLSIDMPSGVNANTGVVESDAIFATTTITFGLPKIGLIMYPGCKHTGNIIVKTIGIPNDFID